MPKPKKKLTAAQRAAKKRRKRDFMIIFINGKQKRVRREPTIDGMDTGEFIRQNADDIWLHPNERWDILEERAMEERPMPSLPPPMRTPESTPINDDNYIPF